MRNKHLEQKSFLGIQTFGEGVGGSSRLGQNPKFAQHFFWTAPLNRIAVSFRMDFVKEQELDWTSI